MQKSILQIFNSEFAIQQLSIPWPIFATKLLIFKTELKTISHQIHPPSQFNLKLKRTMFRTNAIVTRNLERKRSTLANLLVNIQSILLPKKPRKMPKFPKRHQPFLVLTQTSQINRSTMENLNVRDDTRHPLLLQLHPVIVHHPNYQRNQQSNLQDNHVLPIHLRHLLRLLTILIKNLFSL